jgi:hypothetical protein
MEHNANGTKMGERQCGIETTISLAFRTAHLLTASVHHAESAVLKAIESFDPDGDSEQKLLQSAMHAAVHTPVGARPQPASFQTASFVPVELQSVLDLSQNFRRCFVLRVLVGMSRQACAQLLRLTVRSVDYYTCAALQCLAEFGP